MRPLSDGDFSLPPSRLDGDLLIGCSGLETGQTLESPTANNPET